MKSLLFVTTMLFLVAATPSMCLKVPLGATRSSPNSDESHPTGNNFTHVEVTTCEDSTDCTGSCTTRRHPLNECLPGHGHDNISSVKYMCETPSNLPPVPPASLRVAQQQQHHQQQYGTSGGSIDHLLMGDGLCVDQSTWEMNCGNDTFNFGTRFQRCDVCYFHALGGELVKLDCSSEPGGSTRILYGCDMGCGQCNKSLTVAPKQCFESPFAYERPNATAHYFFEFSTPYNCMNFVHKSMFHEKDCKFERHEFPRAIVEPAEGHCSQAYRADGHRRIPENKSHKFRCL